MDHIDRWNILEPDAAAVRLPDRTLDYRELATLVSRGGGALHGYGVESGDRVAVWVKNDLPSLVALWAVPRIGAVVVPLSSRLSHREVIARLDLVEPALVLGSDALTGRTSHATESLFDGRPSMPAPHGPEDVHSIFFTSGSSGDPKGVRLTWGNHESSAVAAAAAQPVGPDDSWLAVMPLYHVGGFAVTYRMFRSGGTVVLEPEFDAQRTAEQLASVSYASLVPAMLHAVLEHGVVGVPEKAVLVGGAPMTSSLHERAREFGLPVVPTYGMSETASQIATAAPADPPESGAPPLPGVTISAGETVGPILVDGPMVSSGYWGEPDREGPFLTGDVGFVDAAGRLHVMGRADDVIISGGENIHPAEIEAAIAGVDGVAGAVAFGVPDETWGERLEAAVVVSDPTLTGGAIAEELRAGLAGFKVPKAIHILHELPLGPTGKVDRAAVRTLTSADPAD
ncbi:MAG: acyl--CoA ligase [Acidimicrobiia bacterium]|nr:acyl--CoA ligase [Acidimicrobiia bacterium]NNL71123.1 acyl--CoA ligase [Acidimicrobiia bacterium]